GHRVSSFRAGWAARLIVIQLPPPMDPRLAARIRDMRSWTGDRADGPSRRSPSNTTGLLLWPARSKTADPNGRRGLPQDLSTRRLPPDHVADEPSRPPHACGSDLGGAK